MDDTRARTPRDVQRLGDERSKSITNRTDSQGRRGRNHVVCIEGVVEVVVEVEVEEEERGRRQVTTRNARVYRLVIDSRVQCSELDASKVIPLLQVPKMGGETRRQERERRREPCRLLGHRNETKSNLSVLLYSCSHQRLRLRGQVLRACT